MLQVMEKTYAGQMLSTPILLSEEIKNAGLSMSSIYEINKPYGSHQTYVRCRDNLNMVFREIEKDICKQWPSRMAQLATDRLTEAACAARGADGGVSWRTPSQALARHLFRRTEERRVGKGWVRQCRSWGWPYP